MMTRQHIAEKEHDLDAQAHHNLQCEPVSDDHAENISGEFYGDELAPIGVLRCLGRVDRDNRVENTSAPAVDEAGCREMSSQLPTMEYGALLK